MRKVHKERLIGATGILLIILATTIFFGWENFGREAFTYEAVIVFKDDIQKGTIIDKSQLAQLNVEKSSLIKNAITDPDKIIGKRSNTFIPRGGQLCKEFFSDPELVTGDGNNILSIPMEWIYSYPQTLRRGDLVHFYAIEKSLTENSEYGDVAVGIEVGSESPLISAKIAYVKDSSNREVIDVTANRMDGSAAVSGIEIVISEDKYKELKSAVEMGQIFIVMYE
ncbi:MAG: SAF domain-containing protein [Aminipila sp.]